MASARALRSAFNDYQEIEQVFSGPVVDDIGGAEERDRLGAPDDCEHIPFFMPPVPALPRHRKELTDAIWRMAVLIFNRMPSYGLGFLVANGLAETYAEALQRLLKRSDVNRSEVGAFLGENLSLSTLVCLSLFDSMPLFNTGVVSALTNVFSHFSLPSDLQKVNRLLRILGQVWWRRQRKIAGMHFPETLATIGCKEDRDLIVKMTQGQAEQRRASPKASQGDHACQDVQPEVTNESVNDIDIVSEASEMSWTEAATVPSRELSQLSDHHRAPSKALEPVRPCSPPPPNTASVPLDVIHRERRGSGSLEMIGTDLKDHLSSKDAMCQLMFSTVLLHWYIHGSGGGAKGHMTPREWKRINQGLGSGGGDLPDDVQEHLHAMVNERFRPELALVTPLGGSATLPGCVESKAGNADTQWTSVLQPCAIIEGWARRNAHGVQTLKQHMSKKRGELPSSMASITNTKDGKISVVGREDTGMLLEEEDHHELDKESTWYESLFKKPKRNTYRWLSLCKPFLFFSDGPSDVNCIEEGTESRPSSLSGYGDFVDESHKAQRRKAGIDNVPKTFLDVSATTIDSVDAATFSITLVSAGAKRNQERTPASKGNMPASSSKPFITVVSLLKDGCWEEIRLSALELFFAGTQELELWHEHLSKIVVPARIDEADKVEIPPLVFSRDAPFLGNYINGDRVDDFLVTDQTDLGEMQELQEASL
jgi:hypothetical protein